MWSSHYLELKGSQGIYEVKFPKQEDSFLLGSHIFQDGISEIKKSVKSKNQQNPKISEIQGSMKYISLILWELTLCHMSRGHITWEVTFPGTS